MGPKPHFEKVIENLLRNSLNGFLQSLPLLEREVFKLYLDGHSPEQIAFQMGARSSLDQIIRIIGNIKIHLRKAYSAQLPFTVQ